MEDIFTMQGLDAHDQHDEPSQDNLLLNQLSLLLGMLEERGQIAI